MLNLEGIFNYDEICDIRNYTNLRFNNAMQLKTPEALTLYEQKYITEDKIKKLCEQVYGYSLVEPLITYMPDTIIREFQNSNLVPITYMPMINKIVAVYIPELKYKEVIIPNHDVEIVPTTIYFFLRMYQQYYGVHEILHEIPAKMLLDIVIKEAIEINAADITISTIRKSSIVYYNVRKKKVMSNRIFSYESMLNVIKYLCVKSPMDWGSREPKYVDVDLNKEYRGRVVINTKFKGYTITMRLLPNKAFNEDIHNLNMTNNTVDWLEKNFLSKETGLRLIVGATMSGKNTTALSLLKKIADMNKYKIISVEMPVEQELPGVEQINTESIREYDSNIKSLIHQNPDFVYITEIRDATGLSTIQITNTGKRVLATLHSNSVADTVSRLIDITNLSTDRIIQTLHSVCYQELIRDDKKDFVFPRNRYIRFTDELKYELYGKSLGEITKIIRDREEGDDWN